MIDDLIVYSEDPGQAEEMFKVLAKIYKVKKTGVLKPRDPGTLEFLGRVIVRLSYDGPILFGLKPGYLSSLGEEFQISAGKARTRARRNLCLSLVKPMNGIGECLESFCGRV